MDATRSPASDALRASPLNAPPLDGRAGRTLHSPHDPFRGALPAVLVVAPVVAEGGQGGGAHARARRIAADVHANRRTSSGRTPAARQTSVFQAFGAAADERLRGCGPCRVAVGPWLLTAPDRPNAPVGRKRRFGRTRRFGRESAVPLGEAVRHRAEALAAALVRIGHDPLLARRERGPAPVALIIAEPRDRVVGHCPRQFRVGHWAVSHGRAAIRRGGARGRPHRGGSRFVDVVQQGRCLHMMRIDGYAVTEDSVGEPAGGLRHGPGMAYGARAGDPGSEAGGLPPLGWARTSGRSYRRALAGPFAATAELAVALVAFGPLVASVAFGPPIGEYRPSWPPIARSQPKSRTGLGNGAAEQAQGRGSAKCRRRRGRRRRTYAGQRSMLGRRDPVIAIELHVHAAVEVRPVHGGSVLAQAIHGFGRGMAVRVVQSGRDDGDARLDGVQERISRRRPAAVVRDLQDLDVRQAMSNQDRVDLLLHVAHQ